MKERTRRVLRLLAAGGGALVVVTAFVLWMGPDRLFEAGQRIGLTGVSAMFALYLLAQTLRTVRAFIGLPLELRPTFLRMFAVVAMHQWSNHIVPARLGEAAFPLLLSRFASIDPARGVSLLVRIRLQEISVLGALFLAALALISTSANAPDVNYGGLAIAGAILVAMPLVFERGLAWLLMFLGTRIGPGGTGLRARFAAFLRRTESALSEREPHRLLSTVITGALLLCMFTLFHVVMRRAGHPVSFHETVVGSSVASVSQLLPINTIGSFGSLEAGWALGFSLVGVPARDALAAGLVMHVLVLAFITALAGIGWLTLKTRSGPESESVGEHTRFTSET